MRRAAAIRSADGEIITDVIGDELRAWVRDNGRAGLPVAAGTVVATSSGEMAAQGLRRIYHTAVVTPRPGTNDYDVDPMVIASCVSNVLAIARADPLLTGPAAPSVAFPLLGTGRGALNPEIGFTWLWMAVERDMQENGPFEVHFVTRQRAHADLIIGKLRDAQVISPLPDEAR